MARFTLHTYGMVLAVGVLGGASAGCEDEAYCFTDCGDQQTTVSGTGGSMGTNAGGAGANILTTGAGALLTTTTTGSGGCMQTNGGQEACDGVDNDCNGMIDDGPDIDFGAIETCGTCTYNCLQVLLNVSPATVTCAPSANPGRDPGTCDGDCTTDYFDLDGDGSCETYCNLTASDDTTCDGLDDDCDGSVDEDVNLCTSETDCGKCGGNCVVLNGTPECVTSSTTGMCNTANTQCEILACDPNWYDLDGVYATGCEYPCTATGAEICGDGVDNDCDGDIDAADSNLSGDPQLGQVCFGDPDGLCATAAHQGTTACIGQAVVCTGPNVLEEGDVTELCNNIDEDCDGSTTDLPASFGSCGTSGIAPCQLGTLQCISGALQCVGDVDPGVESCNGIDDDCDGTIDLAGAMVPADAVGACNVPPPAPPGGTQPCQAGTKICNGGVVQCTGSITAAPGAVDGCGVDLNCNGVLENQPDFANNANHCGMCNNKCGASTLHANWGCTAGGCVFQGCQTGWFDLNGDQSCEYACIFTQSQEVCNGIDDNCNGTVDEGVIAPSPVQVCGVSPSATSPGCTTGVSVVCSMGAWDCNFPAGVCTGASCASTPEICDTVDNNCDGQVNENVPNFGKQCASDAGLPPPGHGACRTFGTFQCNGPNALVCPAMKASCTTLMGGCTENCDNVDNDCDGLVDETFEAKGSDATFFYKPDIVKIGTNLWIHAYEASRPDATAISAGSGNGFHTSAPTGTVLDETLACSEPTRLPWFNVTPREAEQTCDAMGGFVCSPAQWTQGCQVAPSATCTWGYNPRNTACTTTFTASKFCNLAPAFDFDSAAAGDQDGLLETGSTFLQNCWADWSGLQSNPATDDNIFDLTGNLREITKQATQDYRLMGGAYNTQSVAGAACNFSFYSVEDDFKLQDTGFRCCFSTNPTL